ncbi:hypothetical protein ACFLT9_00920 [Acidobacteriota bacterium]
MFEDLDKFLEEIDHFLVVQEGRQEILDEIRSHIEERAEDEAGQITVESLNIAISKYGSPQQIAAKYAGDYQIISPTFKKYLFRYTAILFVVHLSFIFLASVLKTNVYLFPFFFIPRLDIIHILNFIPMALIYDLGLVGVILYFITQRKKEIRLPWLNLKFRDSDKQIPRLPKPKPWGLLLMIIGYGAALAVFVKYKTLFFASLNPGSPQSLFGPVATVWYSLALLFVFGLPVLSYMLRFFLNSYWIELVKYALILVVFFLVINIPIADAFSVMTHPDLKTMGIVIISIFACLAAYEFLKTLIIIVRELFKSRQIESS